MVNIGSKVRCKAHDGEHAGTVVSEISPSTLGVAWALDEALRDESIAEWMASRSRLAEDDGLFLTDRDAVELADDSTAEQAAE
jgi:hypothetical protein